jgi:uncharacterized damage-inducible protein DinB
MQSQPALSAVVVTPEQLLAHWQGHRRLSRRMIEAFPEDQLFTFSVGGMRPFGELALEMLGMGVPMVRELVSDPAAGPAQYEPVSLETLLKAERPRQELLRLWDESTEQLDALWARMPGELFQQTKKVFGQYEGPVRDLLFYVIDNEIHHRGQGYVYLRALGIEPPHFWERE